MRHSKHIDLSVMEASNLFEEVFVVLTPEGQILDWNDRLRSLTGYSGEEIAAMAWTDFVAKEERSGTEETLRQVVSEGAAEASTELVTKEGETVPCAFRGRLYQQNGEPVICGRMQRADQDGHVMGLAGARVGAGEGKNAKDQLRRSEERYRRLFEEAQEAIITARPSGEIIEANPAAAELFGYSRENLLNVKTPELYANPARREAVARNVIEQGGAENLELRMRRKNGEEIICQIAATVLWGDDGAAERFQAFLRDVTQQRRAEEALRESEEKFRALTENAPVGVALAQDGVNGYVNPAFAEIGGYEREALIGRSPETLFHPDDWPEVQEQIRRRLEGETDKVHYRVRMQTKAGQTRRVEVDAARIEYQGKPTLIGTIRDITERMRMQERLRESEQKYRRLFEEAQEGIVVTTPEGTVIDANPAASELLGYPQEELVGRSAKQLYVYPEERANAVRQLEEGGEFRDREVHLRRRDGEIILCRMSASALRDRGGTTETFQLCVRNITEQRQAREALEESERKFRELAEQSLVGISLIQDGEFQYVNPRAAEMFGYEPRELTGGMGPKDTIHPEDWPRAKENIQKRLSGEKEAVGYQFRGVRKDGSVIYVEVYGRRISVGGRPAILSHLIDVTERQELQRDILHIQEEERRRIGQDLHDGVASQLMGVTMLLSSFIKDAESECPPVVDDLHRIKHLVDESGEDIRRISRGLNPVRLAEADLSVALERLAETVSTPEGPACSFHMDGECPENMKQMATHLYWMAQEAVTNARRYAEAENIHIRLDAGDAQLTLRVDDDGKGFEETQMENEGLGLRTLRYRAEMLGGNLSIDSAPGEGTTVRCRLPVDRAVR